MNQLEERILEYMDEQIDLKENKELIKNQQLLLEYMDQLNSYLEKDHDKEIIKELIVNILTINNRINDTLRYLDFPIIFSLGFQLSKESENSQYHQFIDNINKLINNNI